MPYVQTVFGRWSKGRVFCLVFLIGIWATCSSASRLLQIQVLVFFFLGLRLWIVAGQSARATCWFVVLRL